MVITVGHLVYGISQDINEASDTTRGLIFLILTLMVAPTWLSWWNSRVARREVTKNGGKSLADQVDRMENRQLTMETRQELHTEQISLLMNERGLRHVNDQLVVKYTGTPPTEGTRQS